MAWYSRLTNAISRGVSRIFGGRPPEPPPETQPVVSSTYEPAYQPVAPGAIPSAAPAGTPEATMGLPAETVSPTERLSEIREPQEMPTGPTVDWSEYGDEVTMYDPETYDPIPVDRYMTADDWYREALMPADYLRARYGINNIEILQQLDAEGYFVDWDQWREDYEASIAG